MKQKDILLILGSLCVVTIAWIIFNIHHTTVTSTIPETITTQVKPITPDFDIKSIDALKKRQKITPNFGFPSSGTPTPTPTPFLLPKKNQPASESSFLR